MPEYVSSLDQFLQDYSKDHSKPSKSQQKLKEKFDRIYYLRDHEKEENKIK